MDPGICVRLFDDGAMGLVQHDDGYAVVRLGAPAMAVGDDLEGDWRSTGRQHIRNVTRERVVAIALVGNWGTPFGAIRASGGL